MTFLSVYLQQQPESGNIVETIIIVVLVILLSLMLFLFFHSKKSNQRLLKELKKLEILNSSLTKKAIDNSHEIKRLREKLNKNDSSYDKGNDTLTSQVQKKVQESNLKQTTQPGKQKSEVLAVQESDTESDSLEGNQEEHNVLFLPFPDRDKTFYAPDATKIPTQDTFYKVIDDQLELYESVHPEIMQMAMDFEENHIRRACEIKNRKEGFHNRIKVITPGQVTWNQEDIIVRKKMVVEYV